MNKNFYKYSGTEFFEKYLLPSNPHSRIRIFACLAQTRATKDGLNLDNTIDLKERLKRRVYFADRYIKSHILGGLVQQAVTIPFFYSAIEIGIVSTIANVLINGYPILVQIDIRDRCNKIPER